MKNFSRSAALLCAAFIVCACGKAVVDGKVTPPPHSSSRILVEMAQGTALKVVDSVRLSADGTFRFCTRIEKNQPEFYYIYKDDVKLASLVLKAGDRISVQCDTAGGWTVEGSEDCALLREREIDAASALKDGRFSMKDYIAFYRSSMRFILSHPRSMTVVPVLFQKFGDTPVFAQLTDGVIFQSAADSLATLYPDSRYIALLRAEAKSRIDRMNMQMKLEHAQTRAFPELEYPDMTGHKVKLSDSVDKCTLLVFWDATAAVCKVFNQDVLFRLYERYHDGGLQIYQVNIGADKAEWALTVRSQKLPWTNVCDTKGASIAKYGLSSVPAMFLVSEDTLVPVTVSDADSHIKEMLR